MAPTPRATELAAPVAEVLVRARSIISTATPFDPAKSMRRFVIGAPDGISSVVLRPLVVELNRMAPRIDIGVRQILPSPARVWHSAIAELEGRVMDIAIIPSDELPSRFDRHCIYEEDFVIAMRAGHPFAGDPTLTRYCETQHLVVSESGDPYGFVDELLSKQGRSRRIALTVPNFMLALSVIAESDLISALPRRFIAMHAARFGILSRDPPLPLPTFRLNVVAPRAAMADAGVAWLYNVLARPETSRDAAGLHLAPGAT